MIKINKILFISFILLIAFLWYFAYSVESNRNFISHSGSQIYPKASVLQEKLPWPHQKPHITLEEYEDLIENLWIINNYGQYQASEDKSNAYFHDGLDIVLENGTKLFAVESGYVKSIVYDHFIVIGDTESDEPGEGWMYAHVTNLQFQEGDYVNQGDYIADVFFEGLPHVIDSFFWDKTFSYYVITNTDGTGEFGKIDVAAQDYGWNTAAVDDSGNRIFPDGLYIVYVTAYDFMGNCTQAKDTVMVRNKKAVKIRR
jgi:hypothetical protein